MAKIRLGRLTGKIYRDDEIDTMVECGIVLTEEQANDELYVKLQYLKNIDDCVDCNGCPASQKKQNVKLDDFEAIREDALSFTRSKEREFFEEWCKEAHVTTPLGYGYRGGTLYICTQRPGPMIGKYGSLVEKYREIYKKTFYHKDIKIHFIECDGFINIDKN